MDVLEVAGARIAGLAACVPANAVPNDPKVAAATGIPARRVAPDGVSGLDLCLAAARRVLADMGAQPADFGAILAVSFTQETRMPSLAAQAQARLGFPKGILAFDLLQACAGWGYGLYLAALLVRETGKKVLLLDGDKQSAFLKADDPATAPLLSDGGTATVVEKAEGGGAPWRFAFQTDGEKGAALKLEKGGTIEMDGFGVFRFVATDVVVFLKEFLSPSALTPYSLLLAPYSLLLSSSPAQRLHGAAAGEGGGAGRPGADFGGSLWESRERVRAGDARGARGAGRVRRRPLLAQAEAEEGRDEDRGRRTISASSGRSRTRASGSRRLTRSRDGWAGAARSRLTSPASS